MIRAMRYRFGPFELDTARVELRADGEARPVEPQVFALITLLVENRERLVSKDEILEKVWDGRVVSDSALTSRVKAARQALGDDGKAQRYIRTIHGQGLRFVADVKTIAPEPAAVEVVAPAPRADATVAAQPSIAVLPFQLVGGTGRLAPIAEALPYELITELARLRWLLVTARGSSFRLRSAEVEPDEVGRLLGVSYCLSGTVDVGDAHLVVTVTLADTRDGRVVWADRFAGAPGDVHSIREDIRSRVLTALDIQIPLHEAARARLRVAEDLDAWSAYHLGLQHVYRFNRTDNAAAAALFEQALAREPGFARAHAGLSFVHFQTAFLRHTDDLPGEIRLARRHAERGVELDPADPFVNFTMGRSFWLEGDLDGGLPWLERAVAISPNFAQGLYARGWTEVLAGRGLEGRRHVDQAMRLSPLDPLYYAMLGTRALGHLALGEDAEAAQWGERAARSPGAHVLIAMIACVAHTLGGDPARAAAWAANVRARNPTLTRLDFFRSFPMQADGMKSRIDAALARHHF